MRSCSLTETQKCLTRIHNRPISYYVVEALRRNGCRKLFLLGRHLCEQIIDFVQSDYCGLFSQVDTEVLKLSASGTAEAVSYVSNKINAPFFYTHGDIAFPPHLLELLPDNFDFNNTFATMVFSDRPLASTHPYCRTKPTSNGLALEELEFPTAASPRTFDLCSMETMILTPTIFEYLPLVPKGGMLPEAIDCARRDGHYISVVLFTGEWLHLETDRDIETASELSFFRLYE